jgi:hypothetical protein
VDADSIRRASYADSAVWTVFDDLDVFYQERRRRCELDSGVESECVWMTCECGAVLSRVVLKEAEPRRGPFC